MSVHGTTTNEMAALTARAIDENYDLMAAATILSAGVSSAGAWSSDEQIELAADAAVRLRVAVQGKRAAHA